MKENPGIWKIKLSIPVLKDLPDLYQFQMHLIQLTLAPSTTDKSTQHFNLQLCKEKPGNLSGLNRRKNSEKDYANPKLLKFELCKETWKKDKKTTESNEPHKPQAFKS